MSLHTSVAVILSNGGATLDLQSLSDLPLGRVVRVEFAWGGPSACVAATLEHQASPADLLESLGRWAAGRGWSVTIAPLHQPR